MPDMLNVQMNERIDLEDFSQLAQSSDEHARNGVTNFLVSPSGQRQWILSGFAASNPAAAQLRVTKGAALLATRNVGLSTDGYIIGTDGDDTKTLDLASYPDGPYYAYVRFEYQEGEVASRIFWNASGSGSEYAQLAPTRKVANWNLRVEASSPGGEWLKVARVDKSGGALTITDQREFYFEGKVASSYAASFSNRGPTRTVATIASLQDFVEATRRKFDELTGGLGSAGHRWWEDSQYGILDTLRTYDVMDSFVQEALSFEAPGGLDFLIYEGQGYVKGVRTWIPEWLDLVPASKDTYFDINSNGTWTVTSVNNGAAAPALGAQAMRIVKAVSDATDVNYYVVMYPSNGVVFNSTGNRAVHIRAHGAEAPLLMFEKATGVEGQEGYAAAGNIIGGFVCAPWNDNAYESFGTYGTSIFARASSTHSSGAAPAYLQFSTVETAGAASERMRITHQGDLWVAGTTTPTVRSRVAVTSPLNLRGISLNDTNVNQPGLELSARSQHLGLLFNGFVYDNSGNLRYAATATNQGACGLVFQDIQDTTLPQVRFFIDPGPATANGAITPVYQMVLFREPNSGSDALMPHLVIASATPGGPSISEHFLEIQRAASASTQNAFISAYMASSGSYGEVGYKLFNGGVSGKWWKLYMPASTVGGTTLRFNFDGTDQLILDNNSMSVGLTTASSFLTKFYGTQRLINTGVTHGMTSLYPTDVTGAVEGNTVNGGLSVTGLAETNGAGAGNGYPNLFLRGYGVDENTATSTGADGAVKVIGAKANGTTVQDLGATANIFVVANRLTTQFIVKGDGHLHARFATVGTYDAYEDALACRDAMYALANQPERVIHYQREQLQAMGLMEGEFVNLQGLSGLLLGGVGELYHVLDYVLKKLGMDYDAIRREVRGIT